MKISIVGGGIMGLSAAWALSRRGHVVRLFEQSRIPNPMGSSVDQHRLIRYPYGDQDGYVRMVAEAYPAWDRLWADLGRSHYVETGTLALDHGADGWAARSAASMDRTGIGYHRLAITDAADRFPHLRFKGIDSVLYFPTGGTLLAEPIVADLERHLLSRAGIGIHHHERVDAIDAEAGRVTLADGREVLADQVIVAAGPWVTKLLPRLAARVTPSRQVLAYVEPPAHLAEAWAGSPMVLKIGHDTGFYAVPPVPGTGLKIGDHRFSLEGDPSALRDLRPGEIEALLAEAREHVAELSSYRVVESKVCFYDVEPEERFLAERLGAKAWVLSGFSGHGFKFAPLIGEKLAAAIDRDLAPAALAGWAAGR